MDSMSDMVLEHYSHNPVSLYDVDQSGKPSGYAKPCGFWVSVKGEYDWRWWCEGEYFGDIGSASMRQFSLAENHNVLLIVTSLELQVFDERYGRDDRIGSSQLTHRRIDWPRVAEQYDGIIIAPYQWEHRLDGRISDWYYGWDCASGCIWRPTAALAYLAEVTPDDERPAR